MYIVTARFETVSDMTLIYREVNVLCVNPGCPVADKLQYLDPRWYYPSSERRESVQIQKMR